MGDKFKIMIQSIIDFLIEVTKNVTFRWIILLPVTFVVYFLCLDSPFLIFAGLILLFLGYKIAPNNKIVVVVFLAIFNNIVVPFLTLFAIIKLNISDLTMIAISLIPIPLTIIALKLMTDKIDGELIKRYLDIFSKYIYSRLNFCNDNLEDYQLICHLVNTNNEFTKKKFISIKKETLKRKFLESVKYLESYLSQIESKRLMDVSVNHLNRIKLNHAAFHVGKCFSTFMKCYKQ